MQLFDGDNLGKGFCTRACANPFPKIVPMAKLDSLQRLILLQMIAPKRSKIDPYLAENFSKGN